MVPESLQRPETERTDTIDDRPFVSEENLVVQNYDDRNHRVSVEVRDADEDIEFRRDYRLAPGETIRIAASLERAVYRVSARLDGEQIVDRDCLIGSGPTETALIELGNGVLSVTEGRI